MPKTNYDEWKLLYTCTQEMEADMLESFLNAENIKTLRKYPGFSDITRIVVGRTDLGVSIYVRESQYTEALVIVRDIIDSLQESE